MPNHAKPLGCLAARLATQGTVKIVVMRLCRSKLTPPLIVAYRQHEASNKRPLGEMP
jgi:hypothetical protein